MNEAQLREDISNAEGILQQLPVPLATWTEAELMRNGVEAMNGVLFAARAAVSLPRPNSPGYLRRQAVLIGLAVRLVKLYEGQLLHIANGQMELAMILFRSFFETGANLAYLLRKKSASCESFIHTSFKAEKEQLQHLKAVRARRNLLPIEKRMIRAIARHRVAGISQRSLMARRNFRLDGKSMRDILEDLDWGIGYAFGFAFSSHATHGSWDDLLTFHLDRIPGDRRKYYPSVDFTDARPGLIPPPSVLLVERIHDVVAKFKLDPDDLVRLPRMVPRIRRVRGGSRLTLSPPRRPHQIHILLHHRRQRSPLPLPRQHQPVALHHHGSFRSVTTARTRTVCPRGTTKAHFAPTPTPDRERDRRLFTRCPRPWGKFAANQPRLAGWVMRASSLLQR